MFLFADRPPADAAFVGRMPRGVGLESTLVDSIAISLRFPDYFGQNWDAVDECLCDLSWLPTGKVALLHFEVPSVAEGVLHMYLDVLDNAVKHWQTGSRDFVVVFPPDSAASLGRLLTG